MCAICETHNVHINSNELEFNLLTTIYFIEIFMSKIGGIPIKPIQKITLQHARNNLVAGSRLSRQFMQVKRYNNKLMEPKTLLIYNIMYFSISAQGLSLS